MSDSDVKHEHILEAAIFAAGEPLTVDKLGQLFEESERPSNSEIKALLQTIAKSMQDRGVELIEVASGYRFQAKKAYASWLQRLWEKKPPRYSRALLETLALIIYRQPITRGEIEEIRGVAVSTHIMKTLQEREWVKIVGHRDVPGKPALYASTKQFLDYFNLKNLSELPPLKDIVDLDALGDQLGEQLLLEMEASAGQTVAADIEAEATVETEAETHVEETYDVAAAHQQTTPVEPPLTQRSEVSPTEQVVAEEATV